MQTEDDLAWGRIQMEALLAENFTSDQITETLGSSAKATEDEVQTGGCVGQMDLSSPYPWHELETTPSIPCFSFQVGAVAPVTAPESHHGATDEPPGEIPAPFSPVVGLLLTGVAAAAVGASLLAFLLSSPANDVAGARPVAGHLASSGENAAQEHVEAQNEGSPSPEARGSSTNKRRPADPEKQNKEPVPPFKLLDPTVRETPLINPPEIVLPPVEVTPPPGHMFSAPPTPGQPQIAPSATDERRGTLQRLGRKIKRLLR
jgi:hypothetical protein